MIWGTVKLKDLVAPFVCVDSSHSVPTLTCRRLEDERSPQVND